MAVDIRDSHITLDAPTILSIVDPYDIYCYYMGSGLEVNKDYASPFRKDDTKPSFRLQVGHRGDLRFSDYGLGWFGNCFDFVKKLYGINYNEALLRIDSDLRLGLASGTSLSPVKQATKVKYSKPKETELKVRSRTWSQKDRDYWWGRYRISEMLLEYYDVKPITHIWINGDRMSLGDAMSYSFKIGDHYKIYRPFGKKMKWMSNTKKYDIQGYKQLSPVGPLLIITSSLKDVMTLRAMGIQAIAFQSEMLMPDEDTMRELKYRFQYVLLLYDNDHEKEENSGQVMAKQICDKFDLSNLVIPEDYEKSKDISDLVHRHGFVQGYRLIKNLIDYELCLT